MKPVPARLKPPPLIEPSLSTGFPSPAEDYEEPPLDLHHLAVSNPLATYFFRNAANDMMHAGFQRDDILVVDRSLSPGDQCIVIAVIDDSFQVKRCSISDSSLNLSDDNETFPVDPSVIWGIVTYVLHKV